MRLHKNKILLGASLILGLGTGGAITFLFLSGEKTTAVVAAGAQPQTRHIVLTERGFEPFSLQIQPGETVNFSTNRDAPFWPASNLHPTHEIYSAFDPKRSLEPSETWSFTFEKAGEWRFHDHITPNFTGIITVGDQQPSLWQKLKGLFIQEDCSDALPSEKQQCWDTLLHDTLVEDGLDVAFDLFIELYRTESEVPKACHGWGHVLGEGAYELYQMGAPFELRPEAAYCSFGFYHGFIEQMLLESQDIHDALDFCLHIRDELKASERTYDNCIHGIGHGMTAYIVEEPSYWGDFHAVAQAGIDACEAILSKDDPVIRECYDGVFNELVLSLADGRNEFSLDEYLSGGPPLRYCAEYSIRYQAPCYFEFMGLHNLIWKDFDTALTAVEGNIANEEVAIIAIRKLAADSIQDIVDRDDFSDRITSCRALSPKLTAACLNGIQIGFLAHADPERVHKKMIPFCLNSLLSDLEEEECFARTLYVLQDSYEEALFLEACGDMPRIYRGMRTWHHSDGRVWEKMFCPAP